MTESIEFLSAVQLVSASASRLAAFYRDTLGVPLQQEQPEGEQVRWECTLGDVQFAIYAAADDEPASARGVGAVRLAFAVFDIDDVAAMLERDGFELEYAPKDLGWCKKTAVRDPDGNLIELTELGADWSRHLEK